MNSRGGNHKDISGKQNKPTLMYGTLPINMNDARSVTSEAMDGPYRSVGIFDRSVGINDFQQLSIDEKFSSIEPPSLSRSYAYEIPAPKYQQESSLDRLCDSIDMLDEAEPLSHSKWNVNDYTLKPKPDFYTLEQTATFVPHSKPSVVAARIANFLMERNISVIFSEVKAKAKCISRDKVEFIVQLYRGKNQFDHGVIVEVQRRFGFSVFYHRDAIGILDVASGKIPLDPLEELHFHEDEKCTLTKLVY